MATSHIPVEVRHLLESTRYGVSFPDPSGCQMRFVHDGVDLGGFYAYQKYGGLEQAVQAAIKKNIELRTIYHIKSDGRRRIQPKRMARGTTGILGVAGAKYYDSRRDKWAFRYQVSWRQHQKPKSKTFHLSYDCSSDQMLHAFRTAIQFRAEWEVMANEFDPAKYALWRVRRLYESGNPLLPDGFWSATT